MFRQSGDMGRIIAITTVGLWLTFGCLTTGLLVHCLDWSAYGVAGDGAGELDGHEILKENFREKLLQLVDNRVELVDSLMEYFETLPSTEKSRDRAYTYAKLSRTTNKEEPYDTKLNDLQYNWILPVVNYMLDDQLATRSQWFGCAHKCLNKTARPSNLMSCCPSCCQPCDNTWITDNCYGCQWHIGTPTDPVRHRITTEAPVASTTEPPEFDDRRQVSKRSVNYIEHDTNIGYYRHRRNEDGDDGGTSRGLAHAASQIRSTPRQDDELTAKILVILDMLKFLPGPRNRRNYSLLLEILASFGEQIVDKHIYDIDPARSRTKQIRPATHNRTQVPYGRHNTWAGFSARSLPDDRPVGNSEGLEVVIGHLITRLAERKHKCLACTEKEEETPMYICRLSQVKCPPNGGCLFADKVKCPACKRRCPDYGPDSPCPKSDASKSSGGVSTYQTNSDNCSGVTCWYRDDCGRAPLNPLSGRGRLLSSSVSSVSSASSVLSANVEYTVNGEPQRYGEFPSYVRLYLPYRDTARNKVVGNTCGGVIVSDRHIITAGRCLFDIYNRPIPRKDILVIMGDHRTREVDRHEKGYSVESVCTSKRATIEGAAQGHEHWIYDYAVLTVKGKIRFGDYYQPVCLPYSKSDTLGSDDLSNHINYAADSPCYLAGAGAVGFDSQNEPIFPDVIQKLSVRRWTCRSFGFYDDDARLCLTKVNSPGNSCVGDSGSPIMCLNPKTKRWILVGIVSYGPHKCRVSEGTDWVTVAARMATLLPLVKQDCGI